jgi:D-amino-acid dehydrogenase
MLGNEGFDPEILTPEQARRREPLLKSTIAGAVYWSEDGHCEPDRFVSELARIAEVAGVRLELDTKVVRIAHTNGGAIRAVHTTRGVIRPREVVLAAGAWTAHLARLSGTRIPLQAGKGYHVQLAAEAARIRVPLIFHESVFAATPMGESLRLAGTMEFVGVKPGFEEQKATRLLTEARDYLDGLDSTSAYQTWCGFRPCTPDSLPILGRSTRVPNLLLATGHAMLGLTLAPISGRVVADSVINGSSDSLASALLPARFGA